MEFTIQCGTWGSASMHAVCSWLLVLPTSSLPPETNTPGFLCCYMVPEKLVICWPTGCMSTQGILWIPARCSDNIIKMPDLEEGAKDLIYFVIDLILTSFNKCKNYFTTGKSNHNKKHKLVAVVVKSATQSAWVPSFFPQDSLHPPRSILAYLFINCLSMLGIYFFSSALPVLGLISPGVLGSRSWSFGFRCYSEQWLDVLPLCNWTLKIAFSSKV